MANSLEFVVGRKTEEGEMIILETGHSEIEIKRLYKGQLRKKECIDPFNMIYLKMADGSYEEQYILTAEVEDNFETEVGKIISMRMDNHENPYMYVM